MRGTSTHIICNIDIEGHRPHVVDLLQLICISVLQNIEFNMYITYDV
jgi:hypothetical protein